MRSRIRRLTLLGVTVVLAVAALPGRGGEPVEDVDVTVEQVPGAGIVFESVAGGFDRVVVGGSRAFVDGLFPLKMPAGWTLIRAGRTATLLAGPDVATDRPVRFRLRMTERPRELDWEISRAGRSLAKAKDVVPRIVPPFVVGNSLQGIVYLPPEVAPGDTLSFRPETSDLPPGRFVLSGEVVDEFTESEWAAAMAVVHITRSNVRKRAAAPLAEGLLLTPAEPAGCAELAALAAALVVESGEGDGAVEYRVSRAGAPAEGTPVASYGAENLRDLPAVSQISKAKHEAAMNAIRNMKGIAAPPADPGTGALGRSGPGGAFFAVTPFAGSPAGGAGWISIKEQGIEDPLPPPGPPGIAINEEEDPRAISIKEEGVEFWEVAAMAAPRGGSRPGKTAAEGRPGEARYVSLRFEEVAEGCRFTPREPTDLELARHQIAKGRDEAGTKGEGTTPGSLRGTVYAVDLPEDLWDSTGLAVQYVDVFGDVLIDVPRAPVTVLPPRPTGKAPAPPCIESATAYVQAADPLCACGTFPSAGAAWALQVNERPLAASAILSTSPSTVWFRLPEGTPPGRVFLSGAAEAGFAPSCRATTQLVEIGGALDSARLLRGETTPMRLTVSGTADSLPLRVRNLTPSIIEIEGGVEQTAETTGGGPNVLERPVRGLQPGTFDVEWTLATPACPCGGSGKKGAG